MAANQLNLMVSIRPVKQNLVPHPMLPSCNIHPAQPWSHCSFLSRVWCLFLGTTIRKHDICFQLQAIYHSPTPLTDSHTHSHSLSCPLKFHCLVRLWNEPVWIECVQVDPVTVKAENQLIKGFTWILSRTNLRLYLLKIDGNYHS